MSALYTVTGCNCLYVVHIRSRKDKEYDNLSLEKVSQRWLRFFRARVSNYLRNSVTVIQLLSNVQIKPRKSILSCRTVPEHASSG